MTWHNGFKGLIAPIKIGTSTIEITELPLDVDFQNITHSTEFVYIFTVTDEHLIIMEEDKEYGSFLISSVILNPIRMFLRLSMISLKKRQILKLKNESRFVQYCYNKDTMYTMNFHSSLMYVYQNSQSSCKCTFRAKYIHHSIHDYK
jgi:hypothetical protein